MVGTRCRVFGEPLHPILWHGRQWAVTTFGIEARDGTYAIARTIHDPYWPTHMAEKEWCDVDDFAEALRIGRGEHAGAPRVRLEEVTVAARRSQLRLVRNGA